MRASTVLGVLAVAVLAGCSDDATPCRGDVCIGLRTMQLADTAIIATPETTMWFAEFTERSGDDPWVVRLECTTDAPLDSCVKSFTMPDLPRYPTGRATLSNAAGETDATEGTFRLTEVTETSTNASYRISGRVDVLTFRTPGGVVQIDEGAFDLVSRPP